MKRKRKKQELNRKKFNLNDIEINTTHGKLIGACFGHSLLQLNEKKRRYIYYFKMVSWGNRISQTLDVVLKKKI